MHVGLESVFQKLQSPDGRVTGTRWWHLLVSLSAAVRISAPQVDLFPSIKKVVACWSSFVIAKGALCGIHRVLPVEINCQDFTSAFFF